MLNYDGVRYKSFKSLCEEHGLNDSTVRKRLKLGWSQQEALGLIKRENKSRHNAKKINITVDDPDLGLTKFQSISKASKHYGINYDTVVQRIKRHSWSVEQALELIPPPLRKAHNAILIEIEGMKFHSRTECANFFGVDQRLVFTRLKRGWSLKEALGIVPVSPKALLPSHKSYIYQIQNLLNKKLYIGVTVNSIQDRFTQHVYMSTSRSKKESLHGAIYKYGRDKFELKVLETTPLKNLSSKEKKWISTKDSMTPKGYNLNLGGAGIGRKLHSSGIIYRGEQFNSIAEIARSNGIKPQTLNARLRKMSLDEAMHKPFRKSPTKDK